MIASIFFMRGLLIRLPHRLPQLAAMRGAHESHQPMKAIILSAGQGSRLGHLTDDRPKCLIEFGGRSLLDRQLDALDRATESTKW